MEQSVVAGRLPFYEFPVDFHPADIGPAALAMRDARGGIGPSDFIDPAQIGLVEPFSIGVFHNLVHIEMLPTNVTNDELRNSVVRGVSRGLIAHQPGAVGEFDHEAYLMKTVDHGDPSHLRQAGKIDVVGSFLERYRAGRRAE